MGAVNFDLEQSRQLLGGECTGGIFAEAETEGFRLREGGACEALEVYEVAWFEFGLELLWSYLKSSVDSEDLVEGGRFLVAAVDDEAEGGGKGAVELQFGLVFIS